MPDTTAPEATAAAAPTGATIRQLSLAERVRRVGKRSGEDRLLLVVGGILTPLGLLLIVLGWMGASETFLLFEQIPYLISGGLLGLGLVFCGGFVYFAYWHTVSIRESRTQHQQLLDAVNRLEAALTGGTAPRAAATNGGRGRTSANGAGKRDLVATANGSQFHLPDCPVVTGKEKLRHVDGTEAGMKPCRICDPLGATARH